MPTPALLLLIATLLPLLSFALLVFVGKRMGQPLAGWFATIFIAGSFVCSMGAMFVWLSQPAGSPWGAGIAPIHLPYHWIPIGTAANPEGLMQAKAGFLDIGIYVDSLTIAMFAMITLVATLVHVFSIGYMSGDARYPRFFTYLGLFCFSMLGLVIGGTALQLFIFWELVGLCSYLLIGFWYEKKSASNAAIKAFVVNRVGDFGFLIGFGILFYHLGNATLPSLWAMLGEAGRGHGVMLSNGVTFTDAMLTITGIGLFFGAVGKSAQFPLHVWLPDAMEGPTPVSALIHAATMVAAGVYLVGRIFPILTPDAKLFIAIIGCVTLAMAALIALAQTDIKKVLAYSTLSQLGYMILAMGIGSWVGGLFHLITHAFFKALLFLGSGSVIHAAHHEQEMTQYGGLWRKIPITAITFGIAVVAIAGTPGFSAYFSKDLILGNAGGFSAMAESAGRAPLFWALFIVPTVIAYVTAFYMTRCWMLTFWGKPRNQHLFDHAHESPILWIPLCVLAVPSIIGGTEWMGVRSLLKYAVQEQKAIVAEVQRQDPVLASRGFHGFDTAWPGDLPEHHDAEPDEAANPAAGEMAHQGSDALTRGTGLMHTYVFWAWVVGIGLGIAVYANGYWITGPLMRIAPLRWVQTWLYRRMYFDELYAVLFLGVTMGLSRLSAWFDRYVVDGLVNLAGWLVKQGAFAVGLHDRVIVDGAVNGVGRATYNLGAAVRVPSSGRVRVYVTALVCAVAVGLAAAVIVALS